MADLTEEEMRARWRAGHSDLNNDGNTNLFDILASVRYQNEADAQGQVNEGALDSSEIAQSTLNSETINPLEEGTDLKLGQLYPGVDRQSITLPSLPSISNVGSVPFTGTVNNIPGGFQPLPQTAGGRKKLYQLSQFHGGINQKSSARDISDQECQLATNLTFSSIGAIKPLGNLQNTNNSISFPTTETTYKHAPGYGLFQFTSPAKIDNTAVETVITVFSDGDRVDYNDGSASGELIDFAGTDDANVAHVFYAAGNGLYINDANFGHTNANDVRRAVVRVNRTDQNEVVTGWVTGTALINSPRTDNENTTPAGLVGIQNTDIASSEDGSLEVCVVPDGTGTWDGKYFFYASYIFDGGVETGLVGIGTETFSNQTLRFNPSLCHTNNAPFGGNKRIEGARVYFKSASGSERFLLAELSLAYGVKGALDSTFTPWTITADVGSDADEDSHDLADNSRIVFDSPPEIYTYASLNGYYANEVYGKSDDLDLDDGTDGSVIAGPVPIDVRYKTAVTGSGGIIYIGNVIFNGTHMPDSMMYSMQGKPGVFPQYNRFDSPSSDGSPIRALASYKDKILQFKENGMYVINVSNPNQFYAEASFRDCGVYNPCQVFTATFGVIFANKFGCYIYDGQKVISLTSGKFDQTSWGISESVTIGDNTAKTPSVGYDPRSQNIIVLKDIGDDGTDSTTPDAEAGWVYNMPTKSWSMGDDMYDTTNAVRLSNFIITHLGYLSVLRTDENVIRNYNENDTNDKTIDYTTKDIDFGLPSQTKKIFKVYVTYNSQGSTHPVLKYSADGGSYTTFGNGEFADSGGLQTTAFTVSNTDLTGIKSLSLQIVGSADYRFEIQDISILYRVRPIK